MLKKFWRWMDNSAPGLPQAGHVQELGVESKVLFIVYLKQS